jgi:DNA-binding SARP family transcriptional activator
MERVDGRGVDLLEHGAALRLLGGPYLVVGGLRTSVPEGCQRLLVLLALQGGRVLRRQAAGLLWPEAGEDRAAGNLRSVLWRLRGTGAGVVESDKSAVWLHPSTGTDVASVRLWAARLIEGRAGPDDLHTSWWHPEAIHLLPGWYDEWIVYERERLRQQVLHALECLAQVLVAAGRYAEGIEAALLAVEIEPLRESAQRRLLEAHLAEGNVNEARRALTAYAALLIRELGIRPSPALLTLVHGTPDPGVRTGTSPTP